MNNLKQVIIKCLEEAMPTSIDDLDKFLEIPADASRGDYALPCFPLAKILKKSPALIAQEIKDKIVIDPQYIEKVEVVGGYLNFYGNSQTFVKHLLEDFDQKKEKFGASNIGEGKNVVIDYSSPNIAKPFHIGHLRSTVIGGAIYRIYQFLGYHSIGVNFLGDWGVQFGKVMAGLSLWKDEYTFTEGKEIDTILKIYVRYNQEEKENPELNDLAKKWLKKLEDHDDETVQTWQWIRKISLENFQKTYRLLHSHFDSYHGEAYYNDKMQDILDELQQKHLLKESEGAHVVDLEEYHMPPCILITSAGTSIYATRDLAALKDRAKTYDFAKALYIVGAEQQLHFKQIFKVFELMGYGTYAKRCEHVPFGLVVDKTGKKIGSRSGNSVVLDDIIQEAIHKVKDIIQEKNPTLTDIDETARKIAVGAIIFNDLYNSRIKDEIFDWDTMLNFNGETGPYIQYMYVRTKSILHKAQYIPDLKKVHIDLLLDPDSMQLLKTLALYSERVLEAAEKNEPSIVARYVMELAKNYSNFYNRNRVLTDDVALRETRLYITYMVQIILESGTKLLGMEMPEKM